MAETPIPNFDWYSSESKRLNLPPRCPFASVETCPRYYESLSLMGKAGATSLASERDNELLARWKRHPLWPATDEQAASVVGNPRAPALSNFCPEVIYNIFHYFATGLARHYDEFDAESAHKRLRAEGATRDDPRWTYSYIEAQHYSECPLYSPLAHGNLVTSQPAHAEPGRHEYDVFISHASEDKEEFVRPLAEQLQRRGLKVWYDELELTIGDSLRGKIDHGLARSAFGVVVISRSFIAKQWPKAELDGLFAMEMSGGRKIILPVVHGISRQELERFSPMLAGKFAGNSMKGASANADEIYKAVRPGRPLPASGKAEEVRTYNLPSIDGIIQTPPSPQVQKTVQLQEIYEDFKATGLTSRDITGTQEKYIGKHIDLQLNLMRSEPDNQKGTIRVILYHPDYRGDPFMSCVCTVLQNDYPGMWRLDEDDPVRITGIVEGFWMGIQIGDAKLEVPRKSTRPPTETDSSR
jgi:hypothetical protein